MDEDTKTILKIQRYQSRRAADLLVRKYYQEIYVYIYCQIGKKADSLDLTQEIFISALQTIIYYDPEKSTFRTWLYRIATNKVIDFRRKYKPVILSVDEIEIEDTTDYTLQFRHSQLLKQIDDYVSGFDDKSQMIFRLHIYDDQTFKEIAEITEMPEASVKTKFYRLQKHIREEFKDYEI